MEQLMEVLNLLWGYVVPFLVVLTVLIFVHELGHYAIARRHGVRVEVFSIGFGPELFGRTDRHGTRWKVSLLPFGGYVRMFGETDPYGDPYLAAALTAEDVGYLMTGARKAHA
jgi:regulator of sigma E protease